nr:isochorismatase family protein [uncultured Holophaga sp.]
MGTALLIIDVQQAIAYGERPAYEVGEVIARIRALAARVRAAGRPVIYVQHTCEGGSLHPGSPGWQWAEGLEILPGDRICTKRTPDAFHGTELQALLGASCVTELIICGLQSEFCVDTTTRCALALGYPVQLVADGHTTLANGVLEPWQIIAHHNATLAEITSFGVRVVPRQAREIRIT